jgi:predicted  nucleic acid-binding Zn-ribbon protein
MQLAEALYDCDRLKREIATYGTHLEALHRQCIQHSKGNMEQLEREFIIVRNENEHLKDEISSLKLRAAEIEGELLEERQTKEVKLDLTIKGYKADMQG